MVANIFNEPIYNERAKKFYERSPLQFEECKRCNIVAFCGGGCLARAVDSGAQILRRPVHTTKKILKNSLRYTYRTA